MIFHWKGEENMGNSKWKVGMASALAVGAGAAAVVAGRKKTAKNTEKKSKMLKEICLLDQVYVKAEDGKQSVAAYVAQVAKANGANVTVKGFVRFETGEGMEKKNEDFAAEVAAQLGK